MKLADYKKVDTGRLYRKNDYHKWIQIGEDRNILVFSNNVLLDDLYSDDWIELVHIAIGDVVLDNEIIGLIIDQIDENTYYMFDENGCIRKVNKYCIKKFGYDIGDTIAKIKESLKQISEKYKFS